jgi:hypothetical protein
LLLIVCDLIEMQEALAIRFDERDGRALVTALQRS